MVLITETRAYTEEKGSGNAVQLTATHGNVSLTAQGDMKALMIAGAIGGGSSAGVGVANSTLVHNDTVAARIGAQSAVNAAGAQGITVSATSEEDIIALSAAGGVGGSPASPSRRPFSC